MEFLMEEMEPIFDSIVSSYETRIESITSILDSAFEIGTVNTELRESFARYGSVRKKDFDKMMQEILSDRHNREKEVRDLLNSYLREQQQMIHTMKDSFSEIKDALAGAENGRIAEYHKMMQGIVTRQDERRREVVITLKEFQKEQEEMALRLKDMLAKGRDIRINDLKKLLKEFRLQQEKRIAGNKERRTEVCTMLEEFNKGRLNRA